MYMERKESRGRRGASWELPQQSGPIAAELWDVSGLITIAVVFVSALPFYVSSAI